MAVRSHIREKTCTTAADAPALPPPTARLADFSRIALKSTSAGILAVAASADAMAALPPASREEDWGGVDDDKASASSPEIAAAGSGSEYRTAAAAATAAADVADARRNPRREWAAAAASRNESSSISPSSIFIDPLAESLDSRVRASGVNAPAASGVNLIEESLLFTAGRMEKAAAAASPTMTATIIPTNAIIIRMYFLRVEELARGVVF
mmetsp:Transcript_62087/g.183491  ORF Transcript_62087/g.183491 Transcript_62087/m.183491 type:complete len:211 (+) Transcript_62087:1530-2162(+)